MEYGTDCGAVAPIPLLTSPLQGEELFHLRRFSLQLSPRGSRLSPCRLIPRALSKCENRRMNIIDNFHPAVANWFRRTYTAPTEPQIRAWPAIQSGQHVL